MPHAELLIALSLALLIAALSVIARRFRVNSPILMLVAGTALAFVPHAPAARIDPELVLLLLLPPLLYSSGVGMSWLGFRSNLRPILLLAVGCVLFTAAAVATLVHYAFGVSWSVGFVLGAIVSPPDAVAPDGGDARDAPAATAGHRARGREPGERRDRAGDTRLRVGGREHAELLAARGRRAVLRDLRRRNPVRHGDRLRDAETAARRGGPSRRGAARARDAFHRLLAATRRRRIGRHRLCRRGPLRARGTDAS